jgi:adenosylcobinamide-phosphate synthase
MSTPAILAIALLLDALLGDPPWLWQHLRHPTAIFGDALSWADNKFNTGGLRRLKGTAVIVVSICAVALIGTIIQALPLAILDILIVAVLLAQRSLADHVGAVATALAGSVSEGRRAVARIVGRDTNEMDQPAIARAAIESAAENLSDGVVAPALFYLVFGLPGILVYKAVNTADSMIGYRNERYEQFGWAAARLDDLLNWIPARMTAAIIALIAGHWSDWWGIASDASLHRSPNAGWPEAAMARALDVALAGPRSYDGKLRDFSFVYPDGNHSPGPDAIRGSVVWLWRVWGVFLALALVLAWIA